MDTTPIQSILEPIDIPLPYALLVCPACGIRHTIGSNLGKQFYWNANREKPSIRPAIELEYYMRSESTSLTVCKFLITAGEIQFLECSHAFSGKTLPIPVTGITETPKKVRSS